MPDKVRDEDRNCCADKRCPMTMGYYIGGGLFICWLHALLTSGVMEAVKGQEPTGLRARETLMSNEKQREPGEL